MDTPAPTAPRTRTEDAAREAQRAAWGRWLRARMDARKLNAYRVSDAMEGEGRPISRQGVEKWMGGASVDAVYVRALAVVLDVGAVTLLRAIEGLE